MKAVRKKQKKPQGAGKIAKRIKKSSLRSALVAGLKAQTGRNDLNFNVAPELVTKTGQSVPIEERAGFPVRLAKGCVHPKDWVTHNGVKVEVDFSRAPWLPDEWGQGVKTTMATSKSLGGSGGILTCYVAPDGRVWFHKKTSEVHFGRPLTHADGFNGQVRLAELQAKQALQLARAQIREISKGGAPSFIGTDRDSDFFKVLSPKERAHLPPADELHVCIVSARRAKNVQGISDIFMVQSQFQDAGVEPQWYVDEESLKDYKALGLKAVVGGKLTAARNMALNDAKRLGKVCVQVSDDISAWEYRDGKQATEKTDDALNAACAAARRYIISPVAAARFIVAKMRACEEPRPRLGGVYMLGSCARTFAGPTVSRRHFCLGDFFCADNSPVRFDTEMRLKEDYDFTCSHIKVHGSVLRCNRMTLNVKHYANSGGACSNRDSKGAEERRNIDILRSKWPGVFSPNPKRRNEVIMRWKGESAEDGDEAVGQQPGAPKGSLSATKRRLTQISKKTSSKKSSKKRLGVKKVASVLKLKRPATTDLPPLAAKLALTGKIAKNPCIAARCNQFAGRTVEVALSGAVKIADGAKTRAYRVADLRYDLKRGYLAARGGA